MGSGDLPKWLPVDGYEFYLTRLALLANFSRHGIAYTCTCVTMVTYCILVARIAVFEVKAVHQMSSCPHLLNVKWA